MSIASLSHKAGHDAADGAAPPRAEQRQHAPRGVFGQLARRPLSLISLVWIGTLVVLAVGAPLFTSYSATAQDLARTLQGPSARHLLGTDQLGRDLFARLLFGARISLTGALIATAVALVLGASVGLVAGYFRSRFDTLASGAADLLMSIPALVVLLSVAAVFHRSYIALMIVLGILLSAGMYRVARALTLDVRGESYITAARTSGVPNRRIVVRHVLPRLSGLMIVQAAILASVTLVIQLGLGFLGLGVTPPQPSWGNLLHDASTTIGLSVWQIVPPTMIVGITVLAFAAIGDVAQQAVTGRARRGSPPRRARGTRPGATATASRSATILDDPEGRRLIAVRDVSVELLAECGPVTLVDRVSFDIAAGEVVGLVGESGAGKTVTARTLLGLGPDGAAISGSIMFDGVDLLAMPRSELARVRGKDIAYIGQEPMVSLSPSFRIGHQLSEIVRTHRRTSRREAAAIALDLLRAVQIPEPPAIARKYPHEISGGLAQRVVIAIALAGEPRLIVADEPTTALDVSVQMQILDLIRSLRQTRSLAVLLVTHDWGVVADICDRSLVMYAGQVVEEAPVAELFDRPRHPYAATLRAADPHLQRRRSRLITLPGQVPQPGSWPVGCRFADRCALVADECVTEPIGLTLLTAQHNVRCIRADET